MKRLGIALVVGLPPVVLLISATLADVQEAGPRSGEFTVTANATYLPGGTCEEIGQQFGRFLNASVASGSATGKIDAAYEGDTLRTSDETAVYVVQDAQFGHLNRLSLELVSRQLTCSGEQLMSAAEPEFEGRTRQLLFEDTSATDGTGRHMSSYEEWRQYFVGLLHAVGRS